jgi:Xaa-Pro aminopeptidase
MPEVDRWATGPVPSDEIHERQERSRQLAHAQGLDALLVISRAFYDRPGSLAYLTNHFPPFPSSVFTETARGLGHGVFLLPTSGPTALLTDGAGVRTDIVVADEFEGDMDLAGRLLALLKARKLDKGRLGVVGSDILPWMWYKQLTSALTGLTLVPADEIVEGQRRIKSETEIQRLREAADIAGVGLAAAIGAATLGAPELEINASGTGAAMRAGADFVRYVRVHSGPWAKGGARWPQAMDRRVQPGDLINIDIIGAHRGYGFDVLRSVVVGEPNSAQRQLLEAALHATEAAVAAARPGASVESVIAAAGRIAEQAGYKLSGFVGHAIGLETMETPFIKPRISAQLEAGMTLCIEPGLSAPDIGWVSIEQEIVVRPDGPELLTCTPARTW